MKLILWSLLFLLPLFALADTAVLPVAANADGHGGSQWRSSATFYNVGHETASFTLEFLPSGSTLAAETFARTLEPGEFWTTDNILETMGTEGVGMIRISADETAFRHMGIQARIYAVGEEGTYGQHTPLLREEHLWGAGDELYLPLPTGEEFRFNFGVNVFEDATVLWKLVDSGGMVISEKEIAYPSPFHEQYNNGVNAFFEVQRSDAVLVKAEVLEGSIFLYGSTVDNRTHDGDFIPASSLHENLTPRLVGVDTNLDGVADIIDADGDGVLDQTMNFSVNFLFGFYFRIVTEDPEGDPVTIELLNPPAGMSITDPDQHEIFFDPDPTQTGLKQNLEVALDDGLGRSIVRIPLQVTP